MVTLAAEITTALAAGVEWLHRRPGPDEDVEATGAQVACAAHNRTLRFIPASVHGYPMVEIQVIHPEPTGMPRRPFAQPIAEGELAALEDALAALGEPVHAVFNGHPFAVGAVELKRKAHPDLVARAERAREEKIARAGRTSGEGR